MLDIQKELKKEIEATSETSGTTNKPAMGLPCTEIFSHNKIEYGEGLMKKLGKSLLVLETFYSETSENPETEETADTADNSHEIKE